MAPTETTSCTGVPTNEVGAHLQGSTVLIEQSDHRAIGDVVIELLKAVAPTPNPDSASAETKHRLPGWPTTSGTVVGSATERDDQGDHGIAVHDFSGRRVGAGDESFLDFGVIGRAHCLRDNDALFDENHARGVLTQPTDVLTR